MQRSEVLNLRDCISTLCKIAAHGVLSHFKMKGKYCRFSSAMQVNLHRNKTAVGLHHFFEEQMPLIPFAHPKHLSFKKTSNLFPWNTFAPSASRG
jgi:hypothetical protein